MIGVPSETGSSKGFAYDGLTIGVHSHDSADLFWLEEFLAPSFTPREGVMADCTVALAVDDHAYNETLRWGPDADNRQVGCFALDGGLVSLPLWASAGEERVIFDKGCKVFYFANRDSSRICVLTAPRNLNARFALMRVVREFAMMHSWARGSLVIHGAALAVGDSGIIIAGPKGAGKTSLLVYCLQAADARFVSNDRVVVDLAQSEPVARGMPTLVTIRDQTLDLFPELERRLSRTRYDHRLALTEVNQEGGRAVPLQRGCPVDLTPAQLCRLLDVRMQDHGPVRALLFPRVTEGSNGIQIRELSARAAAERLAAALFAVGSSQRISEVFVLASRRPRIDRATLEGLCAVLSAQARCFDCRLGQQAFQEETAVADFVGQVLSVAPGVPRALESSSFVPSRRKAPHG